MIHNKAITRLSRPQQKTPYCCHQLMRFVKNTIAEGSDCIVRSRVWHCCACGEERAVVEALHMKAKRVVSQAGRKAPPPQGGVNLYRPAVANRGQRCTFFVKIQGGVGVIKKLKEPT